MKALIFSENRLLFSQKCDPRANKKPEGLLFYQKICFYFLRKLSQRISQQETRRRPGGLLFSQKICFIFSENGRNAEANKKPEGGPEGAEDGGGGRISGQGQARYSNAPRD